MLVLKEEKTWLSSTITVTILVDLFSLSMVIYSETGSIYNWPVVFQESSCYCTGCKLLFLLVSFFIGNRRGGRVDRAFAS